MRLGNAANPMLQIRTAQPSEAVRAAQRSAAQRISHIFEVEAKTDRARQPCSRNGRRRPTCAREPTLLGESRRQTVALCRAAGNARCATQRGQQALRERSSICCLQHIVYTHASAQPVMHPKGCNIHGAYASCTTDANGAGLCSTRSMRTTRSKNAMRNHATPPRVRVRTCARQGAACAACATAAWPVHRAAHSIGCTAYSPVQYSSASMESQHCGVDSPVHRTCFE